MSDHLVKQLQANGDALRHIEAQAAEIARLRATISQIMTPGDNYKRLNAALATARREGMEQAAQIVKEIWEKFVKSLPNDVCLNVTLDGEKIDPDGVDIPTGLTYEAAIRAAAKEEQ